MNEKRVVTYNPKLARKKSREIDRLVEKARKLKGYQAKKSEYGECAKYISMKAENDGNIETEINYDGIDRERSLAGYNMIVTSETMMDEKNIYSTYHNLWRIEESFRVMKTDLDARPVYLQAVSCALFPITPAIFALFISSVMISLSGASASDAVNVVPPMLFFLLLPYPI